MAIQAGGSTSAAEARRRKREEARKARERRAQRRRTVPGTRGGTHVSPNDTPGVRKPRTTPRGANHPVPVERAKPKAAKRQRPRTIAEARLAEMGVDFSHVRHNSLSRFGGHLFGDIHQAAEQIGPQTLLALQALGSDVKHGRVINPFNPADYHNITHTQTYEKVLKPLGEQYAYNYDPRSRPTIIRYEQGKPVYRAVDGGETTDLSKAERGNVLDRFGEHPLSYLLDASAGLSGAGAVAGKALGVEAEPLYLRSLSGEKIRTGRTSANLYQKSLQKGSRKASTGLVPDVVGEHMVPFGEAARAARYAARKQRRSERASLDKATRPFDRAIRHLNKKQRVAVVLKAVGSSPSQEIRFIRERRAEAVQRLEKIGGKENKSKADRTEARRLSGEITDHNRLEKLFERIPDSLVEEAGTHPKMVAARKAADELVGQGGDILEALGKLDPEVRAAQPYLHARIQRGARYLSPERAGSEIRTISKQIGELERRRRSVVRTMKREAREPEAVKAASRLNRQAEKASRRRASLGVRAAGVNEAKLTAASAKNMLARVASGRDLSTNDLIELGVKVSPGKDFSALRTKAMGRAFDRFVRAQDSYERKLASESRLLGEREKAAVLAEKQASSAVAAREAIDTQIEILKAKSEVVGELRRMKADLEEVRAQKETDVGGFEGGPSVEELRAELGDLLYTSKAGPPLRTGQVPLSKSGRVAMKTLGITKQNKGIRQLTSRWLPSPDAWRSGFVKSMTYAHAIQRGKLAFEKFGRSLNAEGAVDAGGYYVLDPASWLAKGKGAPKLDRGARERPEFAKRVDDLLDDSVSDPDIRSGIDKHIATDSADQARKWAAEYGDDAIRQITKYEYKQLFGEFKGASDLVRNLIDRPTDFWRSLTLNYRPAWLVNNIVGQHVLYALNHSGPGGARGYARAVLAGLTAEEKRRYVPEELNFGLYAAEASRKGGLVRNATSRVGKMTEALGKVNAALSDELPRRAAWYTVVEKNRKFVNRTEKTNRTFNEFLEELKKASDDPRNSRLKELHDDLVQQVLDELVDFNNLSKFERDAVRRVLPFYSWMKGITRATGYLTFHHPVKTALMVHFALSGEKQFSEWFGKGYRVLMNAVGLSKQAGELGEVAKVLTTNGLSPFQTIADNMDFLKGLFVDGEVKFGSENPANSFGPIPGSILQGVTGKDTFSGQDIKVPGGVVGRFAYSLGTSFPQEQLAENLANPPEATTKSGTARMTVPGGETFGIPNALLNYAGVPVKEKNLTRAGDVATQEAGHSTAGLKSYRDDLKVLNQKARQLHLVGSKDYKQAKVALKRRSELEALLAEADIATGDYDTYLKVAVHYAEETMPRFAKEFRDLEKYAAGTPDAKGAYLKIRDFLFNDWLDPWKLHSD